MEKQSAVLESPKIVQEKVDKLTAAYKAKKANTEAQDKKLN